MFAGEYCCKLDDKGRFPLPQPFRDQCEEEGSGEKAKTSIFLKGQEKCLLLYSLRDWNRILEKTRQRLDEDQSRLFMHFVVSEAVESEVDRAGRILIPKRLREYAGIEGEVVVLGLYERIELWSTEEWKHYLVRTEEKYETALSKFLNIL
ncbi:MAG: division/cell wall cluster transcriptional repressor MraZ [Candidatus Tectomicrobia bacterium]|uniref:Transcriptional regulator MraZ n=1 Tax=Tectimicrobiota bacterium TaxID=2528274 RepID=A0A932CQH2_UNCTE|nr:division/cell wall cluster transcriptional repressor MraZ [Candidatus Tectomicrobia bacterium]